MNDPIEMRHVLETAETIAVVGCSPNPARPSHTIARFLMENGYRVVPVNPGHREILGERCYRSLSEIPPETSIDIVDVFRRSEHVAGVAAEAIRRGVGFFWAQLGISDAESARKLEEAGVPVAMDRCILVEHGRLGIPARRRNASKAENVPTSGRSDRGRAT